MEAMTDHIGRAEQPDSQQVLDADPVKMVCTCGLDGVEDLDEHHPECSVWDTEPGRWRACSHCGRLRSGEELKPVTQAGKRFYLCNPTDDMDCYRLVTVGHEVIGARKLSGHSLTEQT